MIEKIYILIVGLLFSASLQAQQIRIEATNIFKGSNVISPYVCDSTLYFASDKKNNSFKAYIDQDDHRLYQLYKMKLKNKKPSGLAQTYFSDANRKVNQVGIVFCDNEAYITQNNGKEDSQKGNGSVLGLYRMGRSQTKGDGELVVAQPKGASIAFPSISPDGKFMIFASNMEGGEGSSDLYICERRGSGWSAPENMGPMINTAGAETTPFIHSSGKIFFASNGRPDSRKLDIYYTFKTDKGFAEPVRFDIGLNSISDDFGVYFSENEEWGYFVSNRHGKDQLYYFIQNFPDFYDVRMMEEENYCFTFYESSIESYDPELFGFKWVFSDGFEFLGIEADHCFAGPGEYNIALNVIDKTSGEELFAIAEYPIELVKPEQVNIIYPKEIHVGEKVNFDANADNITKFTPSTYYWDFGDGVHVKGKNATMTFKKPGIHIVKCGTISDEDPSERLCTFVEISVEK